MRNEIAWTDEYLHDLNEILLASSTTGMGAYFAGWVSVAMHRQLGRLPDRAVLEAAALCTSFTEAELVVEQAIAAGGKEER